MSGHLDAEALYRSHAGFVGRFLLRLGVPPQDVPDLIQEVFLVAHRRGGFAPGPAKPTTWLAAIAFRVSSDRRKKLYRKPEDADSTFIDLAPASTATLADRVEAREALARVDQALQELLPKKRIVFILYELEGQSCEAIAEGLKIPVGTVYSRLHAARRAFMRTHERLQRWHGIALTDVSRART